MDQLLLPYPVALSVPCRSTRQPGGPVVRHRVAIEPDGSVVTPHDLDAERIACALGGYLTCVDLVDRVIPALQRWVRLVLRQEELPVVSRDDGSSWLPSLAGDCCNRHGYQRPEVAFAHGRSPGHLATVFGVDDELLRLLIEASCVPEPRGPREEPEMRLWQCGLAPELVGRIRDTVQAVAPLTASDVLAMVAASRDLSWLDGGAPGNARRLRTVITRLQGRAAAGGAVVDDEVRAQWARSSAPRWAVAVLMPAGYRPEDLVLIASSWNVSQTVAATVLASWAGNGYRVDPRALCGPGLRHLRMPPSAPSPHAVDRLRAALSSSRRPVPSETALALALAEHGTVALAAAALRRASP
ncbi:MAG: hypothetical protein AB7I24_17120 [Candidatus Nanopelagicales bacterium]